MEQKENAQPAERKCSRCGETKAHTPEFWPVNNGKPVGTVCRPCSKLRSRSYSVSRRAKRNAKRALSFAQVTAGGAVSPAEKRAVPATTGGKKNELSTADKLEVAKALRAGSNMLNEHAQAVLDIVFKYAVDSRSPHHEWALKLIADRVIPKKLYEDLGAQASGSQPGGQSSDRRPTVLINVQAAVPGSPARIVTVQAIGAKDESRPVASSIEGQHSRVDDERGVGTDEVVVGATPHQADAASGGSPEGGVHEGELVVPDDNAKSGSDAKGGDSEKRRDGDGDSEPPARERSFEELLGGSEEIKKVIPVPFHFFKQNDMMRNSWCKDSGLSPQDGYKAYLDYHQKRFGAKK